MNLKKLWGPNDSLHRPLFREEQKTVEQGLRSISDKYSLRPVPDTRTNHLLRTLHKFHSLKEYDTVYFVQASQLTGPAGQAFLLVVSINSTLLRFSNEHQMRREALTEWEFIGMTKLTEDFGQVYMRPERIQDKINEYFHATEIDFDFDSVFSKRYFVLASDEAKLRERATPGFLQAIRKHRGLEIEIEGKDLLVRLRKRVSIESAQTIGAVLYDLTRNE